MKRKARIICTVTNDLSHDQRMQRICNSLSEAGYEPWLVGRLRPTSPDLPHTPYRKVRLPCWFDQGKRFYLEFNLRLLWFLLTHRAAVINAVDLDTLLPGRLASWLRRTPCIFDAHEYFNETPEVVDRPLVRWLWSSLAKVLIPRVNAAYTVGPALASLFEKQYHKPFSVIRNVPAKRPTPARPAAFREPKILLYQGMLNAGRGLETAIDTLFLLPTNFQLWLVGSGDIEANLQARVQRLQLESRVRFWGFQPPERLPEINRAAWLGLNLLEARGLSYYYSLANKSFDYIQDGLPSLQMSFPEYQRLQEKYQCFVMVEALAPEQLAPTIQSLAADTQAYAQLLRNNNRAAKDLCWEQESADLVAIYQQVLESSRS